MNDIVERLGWTLVHSVWQLLAVAVVAALVDRGLRRRSANARYIAGVIALGAMFALPCVTWLCVRVEPRHALDESASRRVLAPGQMAEEANSPGADALRLASDIDEVDKAIERGVGSSAIRNLPTTNLDSAIHDDSVSRKDDESTQPAGMVGTESQPTGWQRLLASVRAVIEPRLSLLVAVWVVGVVLCSMRPVWGLWTQWRLRRVGLAPVSESVQRTLNELARRMGLARIVRIAESTLVRVPMVVGYLRPMILLPASVLTGLAPSQLEALLAHELAHVRRHDWLVNALQVLAETLFFFHPAVWWLSKRIRNERELCCDDIALSLINDKAVFARTLLILEELRQTTFTTALAATDGDLVQRVSRLMPSANSNGRVPNRSNFGATVAAMLAVSVALMLAFGSLANSEVTDAEKSTAAKVSTDPIPKPKKRTRAQITARAAELEQLRSAGQAALNRGDYQAAAKPYETLTRAADGSFWDAVWLGHARHLAGDWRQAAEAYQLAISIADRRWKELEQQTGPEEVEEDPKDEGRKFGGPVRDWRQERDREKKQIQTEWPQLVLLAGQVELTQLGDAAAAVKTLSRGMRFTPEAESLERLLEDAQKVAGKQQSPPHPRWSDWMYPMATQRSMAQAYEKLGDHEAAARCWSRIQLSFLAYQVGMAFVDADHLVEIVSRVPADKRQPFHEFVLKHPGRPSHKRLPFAYQAKLGEDKRNPFRIAAKLDAFEPTNLGPVHANMVKLPNGRWLMAYTGGDIFQSRLFLSTSNDGTTWDAPWEFAHNNLFPAHSPSLVVDDDGTIWMLCTSQRFDINRYNSGGHRLWLCSSPDGREWSPLRPIKASEGFQFQYQNTVQLTRDRRGTFWVFGGGQYASAKTPEELRALQPLRLPLPDKVRATELHATFDANNRCHLAFVSGFDAIYRTSSLDMQTWTPLEKLAERREGSRVTAPQLLIDGDRIALVYETFSGYLRRGQFDGDEVSWSEPISIGLPLGGAVLARDGDRVLLPSGDVSAVAAPVLLEAKVSELLSPVGPVEPTRPQPAIARQSEWGPEHHGLRTRLTLMSDRTAVGQPLLLKCELQNVGTVPRTISPKEWDGYRGFAIIGPDGKECEFIARPFTSIERNTEIKPNETRTLFELDIAPHFLIQTAGEYTLRLHGGPQSKVGDIAEGRTPVPPPNDVVVTLAPGELTRLQTLFLKLRKLAPPGWRSNLSGPSIVFNGDGESKDVPQSEALIVHLWFADTEYSEAAEKEHAAQRSEPTPPIIRFGETDFGFGHLSVTPSVLRHWAKCVEQIRAVIPNTKPRAGRGSPDPALDPTAGLPNSDSKSNPTNNANGDLRSNPTAGSGDPRRAPPPRAGENQLVSEQQLSEWVADLSRGKRRTDFADEQEPRYRALRLFRESGAAASPAIPELTKLLLNEETADETASEAATALASIEPKSTVALTQGLKSRNAEVRSRAAYALGTLEAEANSAVPLLLKLAENSEETEGVRCHAIWALGMIGKEHELVVPMLVSFLKHPSDLLRGTAASAIGRFGRDAKLAVPVLEPLLKDNDRLVRHWAAQSLTQIKGSEAERVPD